jgi:uncharacterized protein (TIGR03083 family)
VGTSPTPPHPARWVCWPETWSALEATCTAPTIWPRDAPVAETVRLLRERAHSRFTPPVTGYRAPLAEVLVHEGDMRIPLGLPYRPDPESVRPALELFTTGRPFGFVPRGRLSGLRLVAADLDWSWGQGAELRGAGIDLLLAACGRAVVLPALEGPGSAPLAARLRR